MSNSAHTVPGEAVSYYKDPNVRKGILGWLLTTDHKRIGILYLISTITFFLVAVVLGFLMRLEMLTPGKTIMEAQTYNEMFTLHGIIMIFLFIIPAGPGIFGNFFLPIQIGAKDVFFPRLNLFSWYLYMIGGTMALVSVFLPGGPVDTGWTFYIPYSVRTNTNVLPALMAAFILGFSSILTGLNFVATTHRLRTKGMKWFKMPLFVWSIYATAWVQILATPVIGITLLLVAIERWFGVGIFDPSLGGDPILFQHLFWIYSHPAVYIMILPAMGIVSDVIPVFARRTIFGYKYIAYSSIAIASLGSLVWAHHMFTTGLSDVAAFVFSLLTFLVAVPSAIKVFNWVATLYKGSIDPKVPLLFVLSFIFQFSIGGFTGLMNGVLSLNQHVQDTYFVVAHFHYVMFGGAGFGLFAAMHYWFPKMFGRMYFEKPARIAWALMTIGFQGLYMPMFVMGLMGMPRRYWDYLPQFEPYQHVSILGSWILIAGVLLMFGNLVYSLRRGAKATGNPWGGASLEWETSSPPPTENFLTEPVVTHGPYDYSKFVQRPAEVV
jgi:cytochrome c oxidase subunit 1